MRKQVLFSKPINTCWSGKTAIRKRLLWAPRLIRVNTWQEPVHPAPLLASKLSVKPCFPKCPATIGDRAPHLALGPERLSNKTEFCTRFSTIAVRKGNHTLHFCSAQKGPNGLNPPSCPSHLHSDPVLRKQITNSFSECSLQRTAAFSAMSLSTSAAHMQHEEENSTVGVNIGWLIPCFLCCWRISLACTN